MTPTINRYDVRRGVDVSVFGFSHGRNDVERLFLRLRKDSSNLHNYVRLKVKTSSTTWLPSASEALEVSTTSGVVRLLLRNST